MKKQLIIIGLICAIIIGAIGYVYFNNKNSYTDDTHMNVIEGKVIEIIEEKKVLVEITAERGGYKKGEEHIIEFSWRM